MEKAASIFFRYDVRQKDVESFIRWMENPAITRYLNEDSKVSTYMRNALFQIPSPLLTLHFNKNGKFVVVCDDFDEAIGFFKLTKSDDCCYEVVYVIGEEELWGHGFGENALRKALNIAFFSLRAKSVKAKIYAENVRSVRMVKSFGFSAKNTTSTLHRYEITFEEYVSAINKNV